MHHRRLGHDGIPVGNDFIPNLPNMHINHGALPDLYQMYIKLLPSLNGYINNNGKLHLRRFETFLKALSKHDEDAFKQTMEEFDYLTSKKSKEAWKSQRVQKKMEEKEMRKKVSCMCQGWGGCRWVWGWS
ncbi:putative 5-3 exonuclease domain containing protein [Apostichopus japonicus]|uniref:Putative 5-3 exonuclease domain containing protein n=1 Tax=Stichopus japonicus TaxID=307972 RepID=A0A2G8LDA7_STIJA|nr:putative 5-3 exonuclease domain containing protein [Apostichopus japonicus]